MKLTNIVRRVKATPKKFIVLAAVALAIAVPAMVMAGSGPDRPAYDWNKYDPSKSCTDPSQAYGRCGSMDGPVFNSFKNTPSYGDERNFTRIADAVPNQKPTDADYRENVTATPGNTYWVRTLVHNDANQNLNGADLKGKSVATDTTVRLAIANGVSNGVQVMTYVSASNSNPKQVWDTAELDNASQAFSVAYVPGSAVLYNDIYKQSTNGKPLTDAIASGAGEKIGYRDMDGNFPGCFDYAAYVYVKVTVKAPAVSFSKDVRFKGEDSSAWRNQLAAKEGDTVQYLLSYQDTGTGNANNITLRDQLPANIALVPGTVRWIDANNPKPGRPVPDSYLFNKPGFSVGNYAPHGGGYVMFDATVKNDNKTCVAQNVGYMYADNVPETNDDAIVTIQNCHPVTPVVSCDLLDASSLGNRQFQFKLSYTAKNATFKQASYNFGDGSAVLLTDKTTVNHTYAADGSYTVTASVTFMVNGVEKTVTSDACKTVVSSTTPPEHCTIPGKENLPKDSPDCKVTPVTPPTNTPTTLVNTGPGSIAAVFAATSLAGAMAYRVFMTRRLGRQ